MDIDQDKELALQYGVTTIPRVLYWNRFAYMLSLYITLTKVPGGLSQELQPTKRDGYLAHSLLGRRSDGRGKEMDTHN